MNEIKISTLQNQLNNSESKVTSLQNQFSDSESKVTSLQNQFSDSESKVTSLQNQLNNSESKVMSLQNQLNNSESKVMSLQNQFNDSENQLNDSKELINKQQNKMKELENQINLLQNRLDEIFLIKGTITAKVENGLLISAEINLKEKNSSLDTTKSKFIISTSGEKSIGIESYEKGEQIKSLNMKTSSYLCKPGTYFVRCIVFNSNGESNEIVSNSVTTSGSCANFDYVGEKPTEILLHEGKYKLEVWGAKGGDSAGKGNGDYPRGKQSSVQGGLGGYSQGILNLKKNETVYVYVGGQGLVSETSDGSCTKGGFPDGGGTKTGHCGSFTTVPGTGGGSTSIRIGSDTNYTRVIVAGGGGGASGDCDYVSPGGFGGGLNGGNCYYDSKLQNQGAGTQNGSTCGIANGGNGDPGQFGLGATGKYRQGGDSGGGGGGGWYGGGSGGYGCSTLCSSGGGGSGWIFTEQRYREWQSNDSSNSSKFTLTSSYYLTDATCIGGNEEFPKPDGNGTECGHNGNGYAKITPL